MTLRYTKNNAVNEVFAEKGRRGKHDPKHKIIGIVDKNRSLQFIKKLPAVPSHYCRASTNKKYLPAELKNVSFLYKIFVEDQLEFEKINTKASLKVFRHIFKNDFNIGFHLPEKDKYNICKFREDDGLEFTQSQEIAYRNHLRDKEDSKQLFLSDQKIAKEDTSFICASFNLQKVLNTHGNNMLLYYSRKYAFYNSLRKWDQKWVLLSVGYSYSEKAEELILPTLSCVSRKGKRSKTSVTGKLESVYPRPLQISALKCANLMELCKKHVIPSQFVNEYERFRRNSEIPDTLAETDLKDQSEESS
ncbi:hypothetical protein JTB14_007208 [Gonioctena quinquepunctata]|nr:hypothetical protein JTB14_007208 [Gonioctena quinquepunctata]